MCFRGKFSMENTGRRLCGQYLCLEWNVEAEFTLQCYSEKKRNLINLINPTKYN